MRSRFRPTIFTSIGEVRHEENQKRERAPKRSDPSWHTRYFEARGAGKFETTDHVDIKVRAIYLLLVKDAVIQPLATPNETILNMRHKLAIWISKNLPADHHLLQ